MGEEPGFGPGGTVCRTKAGGVGCEEHMEGCGLLCCSRFTGTDRVVV